MPLYQYECLDCDHPCEAFAPMSRSSHAVVCPRCGGDAPRRFVAPTCVSDCTVYSGERTAFDQQFKSAAMREFHLAQAKRHGVNVAGKKYDPQLAKYPGDPKAWVGSDTDVRQVAEHRNWGLNGKVKVKAKGEVVTDAPKPGLSEKAVRELVHERMTVDPGQKLSKVVEDVVNDHAPRNGKRIVRTPKKAKR